MTKTSPSLRVGLAGAAALAASSSAYADIVMATLPPNISTPVGTGAGASVLNWDVNGDAVTDFQFTFRYYSATSWQALMGVNATNNALGTPAFTPSALYARSYGSGVSIAPGNPAFSGSSVTVMILGSLYAGNLYGGFASGGNLGQSRFLGFRFNIAGQTHYGYLEARVNANGSVGTIDFLSAAFNSTPNTGILTGATAAVPEPGTTLAALAAGGLVALQVARRRKQTTAATEPAA
ncbi:MAG: PEP-CTERM sorting domain-containing protein [Verrucomicrobia bacterium]|nr:PEP-CTERM sorting domain-containing protein [Verrucomicrobiota bacterium]